MGVTVGHVKSITIGDGTNTDIVLPSNWNSNHAVTLSLANSEVIKYISAGTNSVSSGTIHFNDANGVSFQMATDGNISASVNTSYAASNHTHGTNVSLALTHANFSATSASNGLTLALSNDAYNCIAAGGSTAATDLTVLFSNANGVSFGLGGANSTNMTASVNPPIFSLGGNTATTGSSQITAGGYVFAGGANITIQQNNNSISISGPAAGGTVAYTTLSYFQNVPNMVGMVTGASAITQTSGSSIFMQPFQLQAPVSVAYLRLLGSFNDAGSGTAGTTSANTSYSCERYTTIAAVLYSQGVGGNSRSLQSISSTSVGFTNRTQYTAGANGSQYTINMSRTYPAQGLQSNWNSTFAVSSGSIVISSNSNTLFTGPRFIDIPWAIGVNPGNYALGIGASTGSASNSSNISFCGTIPMAISLAGVSQTAVSVGILGVATNASDQQLQPGLGVFTTNASLFSTGSVGFAQISQVVSNPILPFQFIRQA